MSTRSISALLSAGKLALALSTIAAVAPVGQAQSIQAQSSIAGASGSRAQGNAIASPTDRPGSPTCGLHAAPSDSCEPPVCFPHV